jgi:(2Fe-2S) ferredoxin
MSDPLVLVGMSAREVGARTDLLALAHDRGATVAFLQVGDPALGRELTRLADAGHERVVLVGFALDRGAPVVGWLRRVASYWWRERGADAPHLAVATELATATTYDELDRALGRTRPITGSEATLRSAAWEEVTRHRHQVLVCRGPRCSAQGADATAEALVLALVRADLGDDDVLVTHTGCQLPCNRSPVLSVQPDDVWYGQVDPAGAEQVVAEHLLGGKPVARLRLPRR